MPLALGKRNIGRNIETEQAAGKPHDQAVAIALDVARRHKRADGGSVSKGIHTGPIHSTVAGRTDHLPIGVPSGSYVIPADVVSHLGENNTSAGFANLKRMFAGVPRGGSEQPYNHKGGPYGMASGGKAPSVPIVAAGGEHVLNPDEVRWAGGGDLDTGHAVLDSFVKKIRKELIKTLQKLPGPAKS
jgi:hypothetical protein